MPVGAPHRCPAPACYAIVPHGQRYCDRCSAERARDDALRRGTAQERGYDSRWRKYRDKYLKEHPACALCGHIEPVMVVDHIRPHRGDYVLFWHPSNHRTLCKPCHDRRIDEGDFGLRT